MTELARKLSDKSRQIVWALILVCLLGLIILSLSLLPSPKPVGETYPLVGKLAGHIIQLEVADTPTAREQGLSGYPSLPKDTGMVFVFQQPDTACFWMKDMRFDLDMLWFNENYQLIYQKRNVPVASYPKLFCPPSSAKYVIELNAGTASELDLQTGAKLELCKSSSNLSNCSL